MENHSNGAGKFIQCLVKSPKAKRLALIFPEGRGVVEGWSILAKKLRDLGALYFSQSERGDTMDQTSKEESREHLMPMK